MTPRMKPGVALTVVCLLLAAACQRGGEPAASPDAGLMEFAKLRITDEAEHFLFTYLMADGSFATVDKIADVPEGARGQVIVVDTALSPAERRSESILYVADLNKKKEDGSYPYTVVSRFKFERDLLRDPVKSSGVLPPECEAVPPSPPDRVVLYKTDWCGVCKVAAEFMRKEHIPFVERDVEKDPGAQQEVACKALRAKARVNGVPVLDVAGELLLGFDRDQLVRLAKRLQPSPVDPTSKKTL